MSGGEGEFAVDDLVLSEVGLGNVLKRGLLGDVSREEVEREELGDLEESVGGVEREGAGGDFYKISGGGQELSSGGSSDGPYDAKAYDAGTYEVENYDEGRNRAQYVVEVEVSGVDDAEVKRRGGRSMLEIAGFKDEEAEKKRREKRRFF